MTNWLSMITDPDPDARRDAYQELAMEMDDSIAAAILDVVVNGKDEEIRADAIVAFGPLVEECGVDYDEGLGLEPDDGFGPPVSRKTFTRIVEHLRSIYSNETQPKLLRRRAFEVLVRDTQPWQREEIRRHFASSDPDWRITAIFAMGQMTGFEKELMEVISAEKGEQLAEAVRSAGQVGLEKAAGRIRELARSGEDQDVRWESIRALPHVDRDSGELLEELREDDDPVIAEQAEEALEELRMWNDAEAEDA